MFVPLDIRRLTGVAVVVSAFAVLVPLAQADTGFNGSPDAIDRAVASRQAQLGGAFDGSPDAIDRAVASRQAQAMADYDAREHAQLRLPSPAPDVVERAVLSRQLNGTPDLSGMPDVFERTVAAGSLQYSTPTATTGDGFDWSDFGAGAGAGVLTMLLGIGAVLLVLRGEQGRVTNA
jgi:hypothetical protein